MNQTQANRLATMYHWIKNLPPHKLDMDTVLEDHDGCTTPQQVCAALSDETCGTVGCIAGNLPVVFPRMFEYKRQGKKYWKHWKLCRRGNTKRIYFGEALAHAFGITQEEGQELGDPTDSFDSAASKREALARMRRIADRYGYRLE